MKMLTFTYLHNCPVSPYKSRVDYLAMKNKYCLDVIDVMNNGVHCRSINYLHCCPDLQAL
jgi:hypothetical protein